MGSRLKAARDVLTITEKAAVRLTEILKGKDVAGVRLGVRRRGCNGLSYTMDYAKTVPKNDEMVRKDGVTVYVDPKALMHLIGTEMDFVEDRMKSEFVFSNPNAKGECGCGESFNV